MLHTAPFAIDQDVRSSLTYVWIRKVELMPTGVLICSCLEPSRRQHPCRHIGAVFHQIGLRVEPYHFHFRWWSYFHYFGLSGDSPDSNLFLQAVGNNRTFQGLPLSPADIQELSIYPSSQSDKVTVAMDALMLAGVVQHGSYNHLKMIDNKCSFKVMDELVDISVEVSEVEEVEYSFGEGNLGKDVLDSFGRGTVSTLVVSAMAGKENISQVSTSQELMISDHQPSFRNAIFSKV